MTDATTGVGDITGLARDHVKIQLRHGLDGGHAVVEAVIEGVGGGAVPTGPSRFRIGFLKNRRQNKGFQDKQQIKQVLF